MNLEHEDMALLYVFWRRQQPEHWDYWWNSHMYGVSLGSSTMIAGHRLAQHFQLFQESRGKIVFFFFLLYSTTSAVTDNKKRKLIVLFVWEEWLSYIFSLPLISRNFVRSILKLKWVRIHSWILTYCLIFYYKKIYWSYQVIIMQLSLVL